MKKFFKILMVGLLLPTMFMSFEEEVYAEEVYTIKFVDAGWDSVKLHSTIAGIIAEYGYGYDWELIPVSSSVGVESVKNSEIDINMEAWTQNMATYASDIEQNNYQELSTNFNDNKQGLYVPRYVIEGDKERGIEALAPDLKTVEDLKDYADIFVNPNDKNRGAIYNAPSGWLVADVIDNKFNYYNLGDNYDLVSPGSDSALSGIISSEYNNGEAFVAYYWEPTWVTGKYDLVLLEDAVYTTNDDYLLGKTEFPQIDVTITASNDFVNNHEEYVKFLENYETSSELTESALAYIEENSATIDEAAIWFLKNNTELLDEWLDPEISNKVKVAIGEMDEGSRDDKYIYYDKDSSFPFRFGTKLFGENFSKIDSIFNNIDKIFGGVFDTIKGFLNGFISIVYKVLELIPWWLFIGLIFLASYFTSKKWLTSLIFSILVMFIGFVGLWDLMNKTLSIVIVAVIICVVLGFPIGILTASNDRASTIIRPILDTMQTMPIFVYLIPAIIFFGIGEAPAVIATVIYAIVPIIRLTEHGIRTVSKEVVEASRAFGATYFQTLFKVRIPQALPTIMTGVNQTLMMAMAMVVTCSMIGAAGLGMEVLYSVNRIEIGRGLISGTAVVILAIVLDRITQKIYVGRSGNNE
ncbi:MAG: glycine betaine ABC transporter substrate-binding protein [Bacilli bacterium]